MELIDIIKDYQETADKAVRIFQKEFNVSHIIEGRHSGLYPQIGELKKHEIKRYAFHGIGLDVNFKDRSIDFDFAFFPEPRHDGFDIWRLDLFVKAQPQKYAEFLDKAKLENDFTKLINQGIITQPKLERSTDLYFFTKDLDK